MLKKSLGLGALFRRTQRRNYGYVHVPKKYTPHLLGFGSEWRKCFVVHPHTQASRPLESYLWLTGSVLEEGLPGSLPRVERGKDAIVWFEERLQAAIASEGKMWLRGKKGVERVQRILSSALVGIWMSGEQHLQTCTLTHGPRVESFWRCDGNNLFCVSHPLFILHCNLPLELFSDPAAHLHTTLPSPNLKPRHLGLFEHSFDQITPFAGCHRYSPTSFTHTVFCTDLRAQSHDQLLAHGLLQLFCQMAAECVQNGYPFDQDLTYPLVTQGILASDNQLTFLAYQLNTLNLGQEGGRRNIMWVGPTLDLISSDGVHRECVELFLQLIMHQPARKKPARSGFWARRGMYFYR